MRRLLPPFLFLAMLAASIAVGLAVPIAGPMAWLPRVAGVVPLIGGLVLTVTAARLFDRIETNIITFNDPGTLVTSGPFRWTRNPMYLGFSVALVGVAMLVGTLGAAVGPVVFFAAANAWYVPFEERRARAVFGAVYEAYCARVPRWIG